MPDVITIGSYQINKGEQVKIELDVARLPSNTLINIPVHVYRAVEDGPVLLLMAGMHGDEINGIEIIRRMIASKAIVPKKGTVITIPVLNIFGFLNYAREVPDGKDVNRSFPGSTRGSLASRIAHLFMKEVFPHVDYGIDFHTGGGSRYNYPQLRCKVDIPEQFELAKAFCAPFIINAKLRDKSLRKEATQRGKSIIVYEAGESMRMDELAINEGLDGTARVMHYLGMRDEFTKALSEPLIFQNSTWVRSPRSGMFQSYNQPGDEVKKNQLIGMITDPFGAVKLKLKATKSGYIIGLNYAPIVSQGDALFHIGML